MSMAENTTLVSEIEEELCEHWEMAVRACGINYKKQFEY
jgi:hypothetical protein